MKPIIALVYGGYSSEAAISKKSASTLFNNINTELFHPILVEISQQHWAAIIDEQTYSIDKNNFTYTKDGNTIKFNAAFITIHGTPGEDGKLQSYFDMIKLPYVNSDSFSSALSFNKWACNKLLSTYQIPVAKSILLRKGDEVNTQKIVSELKLPCFVKPNDGGSSFGISKVKTEQDLHPAITKAFNEGNEVIIESFVEGREFTCGVYKSNDKLTALPPTEIISNNDFFDYEAKYKGESNEVTPAKISKEETEQMQALAMQIYQIIGLKGVARVDCLMQNNGTIYPIEVNTTPGMTEESIIPQQIAASGKKLIDVLTLLIEEAL